MQPSSALTLYNYTSGMDTATNRPKNLSYTVVSWFADAMKLTDPPTAAPNRPTHILAENIIALILLPKLSPQEDTSGIQLAPNYSYDSTLAKENATINSKNQLPPLIQVTMVAIDETSAKRLESGSTMPDFGQDNLFSDASQYESDLSKLQQTLTQKHVSFRIFTTNVAIKGAKWSRAQKN